MSDREIWEIPTAEEMHKYAHKKDADEEIKHILKRIKREIEDEAQDGHTSLSMDYTFCYSKTEKAINEILRSKGYKVESVGSRYYNINW